MFFVIMENLNTHSMGIITIGDVLSKEQFSLLMAEMHNESVSCLVFNNEADAMAVGGGY